MANAWPPHRGKFEGTKLNEADGVFNHGARPQPASFFSFSYSAI